MIKEMDQLLNHWAEQHARRGGQPQSMLAQAIEFGGIPPRGTGPKKSRDLLNLGELDNVAWEVEQGLQRLEWHHQMMADEHYRDGGYSQAKCQRLQISSSSYYERLDRLHRKLKESLKDTATRRQMSS
ncbi:hypothetical protein AAGT95_16770 [Salinicola lusitanus]|uniref:Uncharacterized protein n=1 Tax=Salinicola lusitanus TaxID=1949085 RepID=A0ABZ3CQP8_9GAMM